MLMRSLARKVITSAFLLRFTVVVTGQPCSEGAVRLEDGRVENEGRVEICVDGGWSTICSNSFWGFVWGSEEAKVTCRQLGFSHSVPRPQYGGGSGPIETYSCNGDEDYLWKCISYQGSNLIFCTHANDAGVLCLEDQQCNNTDIRLVDGSTPHDGRVEICFNGFWGGVCSYNWDANDAIVVCKQLGYNARSTPLLNHPVRTDTSDEYYMADVTCDGFEKKLSDCREGGFGAFVCVKDRTDAGVKCSSFGCNNSQYVRLVDGDTPHDGRVEVCTDEVWGAVCSNNWDAKDAKVVCRQLGYNGPSTAVLNHQVYTDTSDTYFMADVACRGNETKLSECRHGGKFILYSCIKDFNDAGVKCTPSECNNTDIRLVDGDTSHDGRVEMCLDGVWGAVCSNNWDAKDAEVVCRQLGYNGSSIAVLNHPVYTMTSNIYNVGDVSCHGTENSLSECQYKEVGTDTCVEDHTDAGVTCRTPSPAQDSDVALGSIVAGVLVPIFLIATVVGVVVLLFVLHKLRRKKQLKRMQLDIHAVGGHDVPVLDLESLRVNEEQKRDTVRTESINESNTYCMAVPSQESRETPGTMAGHGFRIRVSSFHMRELARRKVLVESSKITLLYCIGEGEFGIVYVAKIKPSSRTVAVKTLKGDFGQMDVNKFIEESLKMNEFKHAHVMGLIGVCLDAGSAPYIIMPYMANGSLWKYLKKERDNIVILEETDEDELTEVRKRLMVICSQIASGMEYLADNKYVHRDLATRNCMIDTHFLIKITDFGLSEDVFERNYFRQDSTSGEVVKLPIKWMAPESLSDGHFSEKSDVWSYGVTMWEIFSGGKAPYPGTDPLTLTQSLEQGNRLPQPYNFACSEEIYGIMMKCWEKDPVSRPTFKELHLSVSKYIERIAGYLDIGFNPFTGGGGGGGGEDGGEVDDDEFNKEEGETELNVNESVIEGGGGGEIEEKGSNEGEGTDFGVPSTD